MAKHCFCHVEWPSTDFKRTQQFYETLFGWTFESFGDDYLLYKTPDNNIGGGFWKTTEVTGGRNPVVYVHVEELEPYLQRAVELGGKAEAIQEMPEVGWTTGILDPDGNYVGLYKSAHA